MHINSFDSNNRVDLRINQRQKYSRLSFQPNSIEFGTQRPSFGSFLRYDNINRCTLDSAFFRENDILISVVRNIEKQFPNGAEILDFACSNGEEAISILAQLKNKFKYRIRAFDVSPVAIGEARRGVHSVFSDFLDSFLLENELSRKQKTLKEAFLSVMERTSAPETPINSSSSYTKLKERNPLFSEEYFRARDDYMDTIAFRKGDIRHLDMIKTRKPVGAILFRNAFYHLSDNDILRTVAGKFRVVTFRDPEKAAKAVVDKVHAKLEKGGVFAIGEHFKDNIFLAGRNTQKKDAVPFKDCIFYSPLFSAAKNVLFMKKSPIVYELEKNGRFIPIHHSLIEFNGTLLKCPTVWQKVK